MPDPARRTGRGHRGTRRFRAAVRPFLDFRSTSTARSCTSKPVPRPPGADLLTNLFVPTA
ncbi:hypothetical protein PV408_00230 [Streptomyces sp. ME18-1-4]|nr:hypothetical protein [Streptomyces sp. ME18-1-4]